MRLVRSVRWWKRQRQTEPLKKRLAAERLEERSLLAIVSLVDSDDPIRALVPSQAEFDDIGLDWTGGSEPFDSSAWLSGAGGVGYDQDGIAPDYAPHVGVDVGSAMRGMSTTSYARWQFNVADPNMFSALSLSLRYDDGFIAWLNGTEVARGHVPAGYPAWDAVAAAGHSDGSTANVINLNAFRSALVAGTNVLAIRGINSAADDGDFLIQPLLSANTREGPPLAVNDSTTTPEAQAVAIDVLANDEEGSDPINPSTVAIGTSPAHGTAVVNANGSITYTPSGIYNGPDSFTYTVRDTSGTGATTNQTLVASNVPVRAFVPSNGNLGTTWRGANEPFNDSSWLSGTFGVGYDTNATIDYNPFIGLNVRTVLENVNTTVYMRTTFNVGNPADLTALSLRMRYDDGFAAFINGVRVASAFAPSNLSWNSTTEGGGNGDSNAVIFQSFNLTPNISALRAGTNILAIHSLNGAPNSSDLLMQPELSATIVSRGRLSNTATVSIDVTPLDYPPIARDDAYSVDEGQTLDASSATSVVLQSGQFVWPISQGGNGHVYEAVTQAGLTWTQARAAAEARSIDGVQGHLTTITSAAEQAFLISAMPLGDAFLGGFQDSTAPDYSEPAGGWRWVTGEPWSFTHWLGTEPNDGSGNQPYLDMFGDGTRAYHWNDTAANTIHEVFWVEYPTSLQESPNPLLVPARATWLYRDNGVLPPADAQGDSWKEGDYDDAGWASGPAELGYGDGDEATVVNCGPTRPTCNNNNFITTWFRRHFSVEPDVAARAEWLELGLLFDDGASVYLNGVELARYNLPGTVGDNSITDSTPASTFAEGTAFLPTTIDFSQPAYQSLLRVGDNVLAVEVHQQVHTSSDVSFDLRLTALLSAVTGVLGNDTEPDGEAMTSELVQDVEHGTLDLHPDGTFTYTPDAGYVGADAFTYRASDSRNVSNEATVTITVNHVPPTAVDDAYTTDEDTPLVRDANAGVLANDTDTQNYPLTSVLVTQPAHGVLSLSSDGSFTYTPASNYNGPDSFTYRASDGALQSAPAMVSIIVTPVNDVPVAASDSYQVLEGESFGVESPFDIPVVNPGFEALTGTDPGHFTPDGKLRDGQYSAPPGAPPGAYHISDPIPGWTITGGLDAGTYNPPTDQFPLGPPEGQNTAYANGEMISQVLSTAMASRTRYRLQVSVGDRLGTALPSYAVELWAGGTFLARHTPISISNGSFGVAEVDYTSPETHPRIGQPLEIRFMTGGRQVSFDNVISSGERMAPDLLANDFDQDGDILTARLVTGPEHGSVTVHPNGTFVYTPDAGFVGLDAFTYQASDGRSDSNEAEVSVNVLHVRPTATQDTYSTDEDVSLEVDSLRGVLANDTDTQNHALSARLVSPPAHGSVTLRSDGSFTYTPAANYAGSDSFTYRANDGFLDSLPATVSLTVSPVNDAPIAADDTYSGVEGQAIEVEPPLFGVYGAAVLADGPLAYWRLGETSGATAVDVAGGHNGTYNGVGRGLPGALAEDSDRSAFFNGTTAYVNVPSPALNLRNNLSIETWVRPSSIVGQTLFIGNHAGPVGYGAGVLDGRLTFTTFGIQDYPSDPVVTIGNWYHVVILFDNSNDATFYVNGQFLQTITGNSPANSSPNPIFIGAVPNNAGTAATTFFHGRIDELAIYNRVLTASEVREHYQLGIDPPPPKFGVLANDVDHDLDAMSVTLAGAPQHGVVDLHPDGTFRYTPESGFFGTDSFTYRASDGQAQSNEATVTLNVSHAPPSAANDFYSVLEDGILRPSAATGVLANDSDTQNHPLTAMLMTPPQHGALSLATDGSFRYTPAANFAGTDTFTYRASDGAVQSNPATVTINVTPVNDPPVANRDVYATGAGETLSIGNSGVRSSYAAAVLADGPLGYWRLGETSAAEPAIDLVAAHNGQYLGGVSLGRVGALAGDADTAGFFGASSGYVDVANSSAFNFTNNFTVEGWIKPSSLGQFRRFAARGDVGSGWGFGTRDTRLVFTTTTVQDYYSPSGVITVGNWHHVVAVFDASDDVSFYLNGEFLGEVDGTGAALSSNATLHLGSTPLGGQFMDSVVDEVAIYDRPLTALQIRRHYLLGSREVEPVDYAQSIHTSAPLAYWRLGEMSGTTAVEEVGGRSGIYAGGVTLGQPGAVLGDRNTSADFDGSTGYVEMSDAAAFSLTSDFTIEAWIWPDNLSGIRRVFSNRSGASGGYSFGLNAGNLMLSNHGRGNYITGLNLTSGRWYHVAVSFSSANQARFYVDGELIHILTGTAPALASSRPPTIGRLPTPDLTGFESFDGLIDEVAVYGRVVSGTEIRDHYLAGSATGTAPATPGLGQFVWPVSLGGNGHVYERVVQTMTWPNARLAAEMRSLGNVFGHLATITSAAEADFIATRFASSNAWIGAYQNPAAPGFSEPGGGWQWVTSEPFVYAAWGPGEPNNIVAGEDVVEVVPQAGGPVPYLWNDARTDRTNVAYWVEYPTAFVDPPSGELLLTPRNQTWKYRDNITNGSAYPVDAQGDRWTENDYLDSAWPTGGAILGYDVIDAGPVVTTIGYGGNPSDKYRTALFRRSFSIADADRVRSLSLDLLADDGAAIYINGREVLRHNLPGTLGDNTLRTDTLTPTGGNEATYTTFTVDLAAFPGLLVDGANTIAAEVHQSAANSSDLGFDLAMTALVEPDPGPAGVLENDTDVEDSPLTVALATGPYHGTLDLHADGTFTYTPTAGFTGVDQFSYRASDGAVSSNLALVTINVGGINLVPTAADDRYIVWGGRPLVVSPGSGLLANDFDANGDAISATVVDHPFSGVVTLAADGSFSYTPEDGFTGRDSFTYRVGDGQQTATATATIEVLRLRDPINAIPRAVGDAYTTPADSTLVLDVSQGVLANDIDAERRTLVAVVERSPWHGSLDFDANGALTYTPLPGFTGGDSFTYRAMDGNTTSAPATVTIEVTTVPQGTLPPASGAGDLDRDGDVDERDLRMTMRLVGERLGTLRYDAMADLDGNGWIALDDVVAVRNRIGTPSLESATTSRSLPTSVSALLGEPTPLPGLRRSRSRSEARASSTARGIGATLTPAAVDGSFADLDAVVNAKPRRRTR